MQVQGLNEKQLLSLSTSAGDGGANPADGFEQVNGVAALKEALKAGQVAMISLSSVYDVPWQAWLPT